jgi:hypothetical protein
MMEDGMMTRVSTDDSPEFTAEYIPAEHWNGFAVPYFSTAEAHKVVQWITTLDQSHGSYADSYVYAPDSDTFTLIETDTTTGDRTSHPAWTHTTPEGTKLHNIGAGYIWQECEDEDENEDYPAEWFNADWLESAIANGNLSPAARDMPPRDVLAQYAEANAITKRRAAEELDAPHFGHSAHFSGAWFCDTCNSPYCDRA